MDSNVVSVPVLNRRIGVTVTYMTEASLLL